MRNVLLIAVVASSSNAWSSGQGSPFDAQALVLFKTAKQLFAAGEYEAAIKSFEASHLRRLHRNNLYYIGESYRRLGKLRLSYSYYSRFAAMTPPQQRGQMLQKLERLRWARTCRVVVQSTPGGATVFIDGHRRGLTADDGSARTFEVPGGEHRLQVRRRGYRTYEAGIEAEFGEDISLEPVLVAATSNRDTTTVEQKTTSQVASVSRQQAVDTGDPDNAPFVQLGLGVAVDAVAAAAVDVTSGYRLELGRFGIALQGQASLTLGQQGQSLALLGGVGGQVSLGSNIWLEASLSAGLSLLFGVDEQSELFRGAVEVDGPFATFVLRPALALWWITSRSLIVGLSPSVDYSPRHADFAVGVEHILRYRLQALVGWRW